MEIVKEAILDILDSSGAPALSSTSDVPVIETKPDATNEGAPPAAPAEEAGKTQAESATAPEETKPPASDEPKPARGVQKRLDELTRQREDERRRAEAAEARLDRALSALEQRGHTPAVPKADAGDPEPVRPSKADYPEADAYEQAILDYAEQKATWSARKEISAARAQSEERSRADAVEQAQNTAREAYAGRVEKIKAKHADFEEVAESPDVQVSIPMAAAILHSENGPELQYYLGKNPNEAERIRQLSPPLQLMELGKIEAKLIAPLSAKPAVSAAPAPIKPLTGAAPTTSKSPEDMTMDEYAAYRRAQNAPTRAVRH